MVDSRDAFTAFAPGRVNLIGDHTDYNGGVALPAALNLGVTITGVAADGLVDLVSREFDGSCAFSVDAAGIPDPAARDRLPQWGRYVWAVYSVLGRARLRPRGVAGTITSTLPAGLGLSSSAALEVCVAIAAGVSSSDPLVLAELLRQAEFEAVGVRCGVMDHWASLAGRAQSALFMNFGDTTVDYVPLPPDVAFTVIDPGQSHSLADSPYGERRAECEAAAAIVGPLPRAAAGAIAAIDDPVLRRRARYVREECDRVHTFRSALGEGDFVAAGAAMTRSYLGLRDDFEASTATLDAAVTRLTATEEVFGVRITGGGFGGGLVAMHRPDTQLPIANDLTYVEVIASAGSRSTRSAVAEAGGSFGPDGC